MTAIGVAAVFPALSVHVVQAQDDDALRETPRKAQSPLDDVKAMMTNNTIAFGGGGADDIAHSLKLEPTYSIENQIRLILITSAALPILGIEPAVVMPSLSRRRRPADHGSWRIVQFLGLGI